MTDDTPSAADADTDAGTETETTESTDADANAGSADEAARTDGGELAASRRDYLRGVGTAAAASAVGVSGAAGSAVAQSGDWEAAADQRIQDHRTGDLEVEVVDDSGQPVSGATVSVDQQSHDFNFGTAVNADIYVNGRNKNGGQVSDENLQKYRDTIHNEFNTAVLENAHKWAFWENNQQLADQATDELTQEHDMTVRGHVCIWGRTDVGAIPNDVLTAANNGDAQTIRDRTHQHIEDIISHYGDQIDEWEVVNEALHTYVLQVGVYGDQIYDGEQQDIWTGPVVPWKSELLAEWYQTAQEAAPEDVDIGINDFNVLSGEYDYAMTWFPNQAQHLIDSGIDLDFMGCQSHMRVDSQEDRRIPPETIMADLDTLANTVDSLRITEFDFAQSSPDHITEQEQADYFYKFLKTTFSHPAVDQWLMWGIWDANHWSDPPMSVMFDENFDPKPGYQVWQDLVFGEWWTDDEGTTDASGVYSTAAILGTHAVEAELSDGTTSSTTVEVTDADGTTTVTVTVSGGGGGDGPEWPADATDPDDDGDYEDLTGNGEIDNQDVVTFFQNMGTDANPGRLAESGNLQYYDYTDNDSIDYQDLIQLFGEIAA